MYLDVAKEKGVKGKLGVVSTQQPNQKKTNNNKNKTNDDDIDSKFLPTNVSSLHIGRSILFCLKIGEFPVIDVQVY